MLILEPLGGANDEMVILKCLRKRLWVQMQRCFLMAAF